MAQQTSPIKIWVAYPKYNMLERPQKGSGQRADVDYQADLANLN